MSKLDLERVSWTAWTPSATGAGISRWKLRHVNALLALFVYEFGTRSGADRSGFSSNASQDQLSGTECLAITDA